MKKFKTLSDEQVVGAAWSFYQQIALREQARADNSKNKLAKARAQKAWARERELHDELLRIENRNSKRR